MGKTDLLKQAIADAAEIQKVAIENAKKTISESFDSKLKSILAAKMNEEADADEDESEDELDEKVGKGEDEINEPFEDEADAQVDESKDADADDQPEESEDETEEADEAYDIEAILKEMEDEAGLEEKVGKGEDEINEPFEDDAENQVDESNDADEDDAAAEEAPEETEESFDLSALLKELKGETEEDENPEAEEAKEKIAELTKKLNEVNLLNAKLLYLNKILSENDSLTESQKIKLINAFDEASNVKEVKLIHKTLNEAFKVKTKKAEPKKAIKESVQGFASNAVGNAKKMDEPIIDSTVSRWQFLANIKK